MKITHKIINKLISIAKRNKLIQSLFEKPIELDPSKVFGKFTDQFGNEFDLYDDFRSKIRPNWQNALKPRSVWNPEKLDYEKLAEQGDFQFNRLASVINATVGGIQGKNVLEVGCHFGSVCYAAAASGAQNVIGTEYNQYKVDSFGDSNITSNDLENIFKQVRGKLKKGFNINKNINIEFKDDDICNSKLPDNYFDVIVSFDVLEHLSDPHSAFKSIHRILKPGGIAIFEYNPFFCLSGGHSLCTLDFPWGHIRLAKEDFEKYIKELRPDEYDIAISFYQNGMNRMSVSNAREFTEKAGLRVLDVIPFAKEQHVRMLTNDIIKQTQKIYPSVTMLDLVSQRVLLIQQKV